MRERERGESVKGKKLEKRKKEGEGIRKRCTYIEKESRNNSN